jgi:uncharacterized membrane protein
MTESGPDREAPSRWPRWKSILLVASLALNLLIFGLMTAAGIKHGWGPPPSVQQATLLRFARTLPDERKKEIWATIRPELRAARPLWRELRQARADARSTVTAEPFDLAKYRQAHDRLLDVETRLRKALHPVYEVVATHLTPEERREYAKWQARAERPWRGRHHRRPAGEDDDGEERPQNSQSTPVTVTQTPGKQ